MRFTFIVLIASMFGELAAAAQSPSGSYCAKSFGGEVEGGVVVTFKDDDTFSVTGIVSRRIGGPKFARIPDVPYTYTSIFGSLGVVKITDDSKIEEFITKLGGSFPASKLKRLFYDGKAIRTDSDFRLTKGGCEFP